MKTQSNINSKSHKITKSHHNAITTRSNRSKHINLFSNKSHQLNAFNATTSKPILNFYKQNTFKKCRNYYYYYLKKMMKKKGREREREKQIKGQKGRTREREKEVKSTRSAKRGGERKESARKREKLPNRWCLGQNIW